MCEATSRGWKPFRLHGRKITCALALLLCALCLPAMALQSGVEPQQFQRVAGIVLDPQGAPVADAEISFRDASSQIIRVKTGSDGRFSFEVKQSALPGTLTVEASGFARYTGEINPLDKSTSSLSIRLALATFSEQVTVTATRTATRLGETAASVVLLSSEELSTTGAVTLDDALRQVPGFNLFRRSGSRTANPTSQGVSLRGVGASGASRALVLADGVPLNDPFGGWIYWGRIPRESVSQVEILRGGASSLYGTDALGGVINIITRKPTASSLSLEASVGTQQTADASLQLGGVRNGWGASVSAEAFRTDGYIVVAEPERGRVDTQAASRRAVGEVLLEKLISGGRLFGRGSIYDESRENGTPLQLNSTLIRHLAIGLDWRTERVGSFSMRVYGSAQLFNQDFSAVAADRNSETLTRSQRVPAQQIGFSGQWSRAIGTRHVLVAGMDAREVRGASDEIVFIAGISSSTIGAGGRERAFGLFGQDIIRITPRLILTAGARFDRWRNYDALSQTRTLAQPARITTTEFPDRTETAFSPRLSALYQISENVSLNLSGYRAFRAPTLNELYRSFRVGNVLTLANEDLRAERLTGGEAGASFAFFKKRMNLRTTVFWSIIESPVANVTLSVTPALITRQRRNLGRTRSRGFELEWDARLTDSLEVSGGYLFADASVLSFPANTSLEGLLIPQTPRHQLNFQFRYLDASRFNAGVQGRIGGAQFDDDQNLFRLEPYFTLDALVSRPVGRRFEVFASAENLLNQRYSVGRTPVRTISPPLFVRFGVRLRLGSR